MWGEGHDWAAGWPDTAQGLVGLGTAVGGRAVSGHSHMLARGHGPGPRAARGRDGGPVCGPGASSLLLPLLCGCVRKAGGGALEVVVTAGGAEERQMRPRAGGSRSYPGIKGSLGAWGQGGIGVQTQVWGQVPWGEESSGVQTPGCNDVLHLPRAS